MVYLRDAISVTDGLFDIVLRVLLTDVNVLRKQFREVLCTRV